MGASNEEHEQLLKIYHDDADYAALMHDRQRMLNDHQQGSRGLEMVELEIE